MLTEKNLENATEMHKLSKESEGAYKSAVNNIIIGIKGITKEGKYEYTHWSKLPIFFTTRLKNWLNKLGYEVKFRNEIEENNVKLVEVFIKWHYPFRTNLK